MRYRLMAIYRGVPYEAGVGPTDRDVVLFAACPPPEELGFLPAPGHWRKPVTRAEVDDVWESRPAGMFGGEPCIVLDDLGDELHIGYTGTDVEQAGRLGYCEVEPGVFEVLAPREAVTGITEERVHHPLPRLQPVAADDPAVPGGAPARVTRQETRQTFTELADLAALPPDSYAVDEEVEGAMCLIGTEAGFEVFFAQDGARHEARLFADEEAAYFYLFGLLAAEAVRDGRLVPGEGPGPVREEQRLSWPSSARLRAPARLRADSAPARPDAARVQVPTRLRSPRSPSSLVGTPASRRRRPAPRRFGTMTSWPHR